MMWRCRRTSGRVQPRNLLMTEQGSVRNVSTMTMLLGPFDVSYKVVMSQQELQG